jgi:hypothetical protein
VDVVNGTGDPAVADRVAAGLRAAGLTVGTVSTGAAAASGVEYPAGQQTPAQWLANALGTALRTGGGSHVTVVLGSAGSAGLASAAAALPACG